MIWLVVLRSACNDLQQSAIGPIQMDGCREPTMGPHAPKVDGPKALCWIIRCVV